MNCPKCAGASLAQRMGPDGIVVESCAACGGVWLDKGEIYHYVKNPQRLFQDYQKAYKNTSPSERACPRCQVKMLQAQFPAPGPLIDACARCGGNWFDAGEVQAMLDKELGQPPASEPAPAPKREAQTPSQARPSLVRAGGAVTLAALPSLALRSTVVLGALYGVLMGFTAVAVYALKLPVDAIFLGAAAEVVLVFLISPFLTDMSMSWFHKFHWANPEDLPPHMRKFINDVCQTRDIPFPRVGVLKDGNPNAFTYGHTPGNARLVVTQGVIDMLEPVELDAVVGHEIGHIVHWDMLVMTVAALVPLVLYTIYKVCIRIKAKKNNPFPLIALVALILYYVTEYTVLFLSRTRELYADRFSGEITRDPNSLASALVKIAYGLAGHRESVKEEESAHHDTVRAMGIFDPVGAMGLVAASLTKAGAPSKENILGAMQWDLWNPWAKYYELQSTHPLPAHRLELLGQQASAYGQTPFVNFDLKQPESYWDEFLVDVAVMWLPWLLAGASIGLDHFRGVVGSHMWLGAGAGWAIGNLCRTWFSYRTGFYPDMTVAAALKKVKVSGVRGIPIALKGNIIGRGVPGYIISEDMVMQDATGFMFLDYRQPLALFQWIFAISRVPALIGREVSVIGWYRRAPVPYLELRSFVCDGQTSTCYALEAKYAVSFLVLAFCALGLLGFF